MLLGGGLILTVTKLYYFASAHNLAGAAGHASLARKLASLRRFEPDVRRTSVLLPQAQIENPFWSLWGAGSVTSY